MISASHALGYYRGVLGIPPSTLKPRHARGFLCASSGTPSVVRGTLGTRAVNCDERCRRSPKGSSKGISPRTLLLLLAAGPVRALGQLAICAVLDPYTRCRWQALARLCESGGSRRLLCVGIGLGHAKW